MNVEDSRNAPGAGRRQGTVLESVEDVRAQIRASLDQSLKAAAAPATPAAAAATEQDDEARAFRPTLRPPTALLIVLDDGDDAGETVRLRADSFVIGRVEGDLVIPHDLGISGRHAEIARRAEDGGHAWYLRDLKSTNGTFVRVSTCLLHHDQELLIGGRRFRVEGPPEPAPASAVAPASTLKLDRHAIAAQAASHPNLVDVSIGRPEVRYPLTGPEHWVGRDGRLCSIVVDDPMVDRKHARVYRDAKGRWVIVNNGSRNGLWARVNEAALGRGGFFQCGEQRFQLRVL